LTNTLLFLVFQGINITDDDTSEICAVTIISPKLSKTCASEEK